MCGSVSGIGRVASERRSWGKVNDLGGGGGCDNGALRGLVGGEQFSGLGEQVTVAGAEQAEVANLDEARRENVLQETTDELGGGDGAELELVGGRLIDLTHFQRLNFALVIR
ncbi:MAG TPA: hypothetical protein VMM84_01635 [Pyrinomonadaceae bacterium]|nr:hypothetical protein [Pyrinomonadaceae bacterium]